jgi:hypothetical protein
MANLRNMKVNSKVSRINDMLVNCAVDVSYSASNMGAGLAITIRAKDREAPEARDYRLELNTVDIGVVIETLLNPIKHFSLSVFASSRRPSNDAHPYSSVLEEHGIKYSTYRYPAKPYADKTERWYWAVGVNRYHAEHQMARLLKPFNPALLEEYQVEGTD